MFESTLPLIWKPIPSIVSCEINLRLKVVERVGYFVVSNPFGFYQQDGNVQIMECSKPRT